ncbi:MULTISPECIES: MFS transporter [Pantoea]|jgi:ACS family hexuronate transporter-like MFS transporter|uniref:MFS transporter n=1 Tax=Pantoea brenneri TaxID=472694 RepID=A0A7Y6NGJ6_9GAMM|nr:MULTISPECIES: MFS transporter [Pantoea]KKD31683.1 hexuronate transporter [Pantoea sp. 3.5.1]MBZ6395711.1 MFS transporter [Pantoea sp.]MBZ6439335.1 MFS transporter [Pantoea sp.]MCQ5473098.1 MFS transporter [Pantoea brenneri]MDH1087682.1 MFS transporter [Pantoea brenneri]
MSLDSTTKPISASRTVRVIKNLRWWMLGMFLLGVTVNYITRNSLGILAPELKNSLNMSTEQYSWVVAGFQLAYTLFQPVCGWLIDVIGLKMGFLICALIWSVTCLLHAGAGSWLHLALLRFVMGASEAAATPANAKAIGDWFPKQERPVAAGWAGVGFSVGAMLAPPIIYLAHISFGWQGAFLLTGGLGLLWVGLWWWGYHAPDRHPRLSDEERAFINQDNEAVGEKLPFFTALKVIGKEKKFYGIAIPAFLAEPAWAVLSFWVPLYLANERGMDLKQIVMFAWLPFLAADLGSVASGYLTKLYVRWFGLTRVNSIVASSVTGALLMVSLALMTLVDDPWLAIALISVGGFGHQVISCMLSALVVERFDRRQMATVNGMRGSCAWIASFIFSLIIGVTADTIGFNPLFVAMGFFDLIGAVFLVMLIAERRQRPVNH